MTTDLEQNLTAGEKISQLRKLLADAPELGRKALENVLQRLATDSSQVPPALHPECGPGRKPPGQGLRADDHHPIRGRRSRTAARIPAAVRRPPCRADDVGSVHDMRFVFLDNDTRMLFATAYDGDWDAYVDDFATKIPDFLDIIDSVLAGLAGDPQPGSEGLPRQVSDHGGRVVRRQ
jgi:hypothetical protein